MYRLSIGAIMKNESSYIIEWIAYHLLIGVEHFYIADNCSDDGQYQLLKSLEDAGVVTLIHQENLSVGSAQVAAYNKILNFSSSSSKLIAFIDGDEFIAINDFTKFNYNLDLLISDEECGAIGLNWKTFGSSGNLKSSEGLVIERFTQCGNKLYRGNWTIKTISKPTFVEKQLIHHAILKKGKYKAISLESLTFESGKPEGPRTTTFNYDIAQINHYVIKSKEEFVLKKMNRGCANRGENQVKLLQYFDNHDVNDDVCDVASKFSDKVKYKVKEINDVLKNLGCFEDLQFNFDHNEDDYFSGWVKFKNKKQSLKLRVLVDNCDEFFFDADINRPKLLAQSGGVFGNYGFNFTLPKKPKTNIIITVVGNVSPPIYFSKID